MSIEVIEDFLPQDAFTNLQKFVMNNSFPWFYQDFVIDEKDPLDNIFLAHLFYKDNRPNSEFYDMVCRPFLDRLKPKAIIRIKANLYLNQQKIIKHRMHTDFEYPHKGALFFFNTNNGKTIIEDQEIESKQNNIVLFDSSKPHASTTCTDKKARVTLVFNYL
jgi:hypothetical protein|tara:strand:+ start:2792 stop:3277 length:486 start_codon:yes stop_codon:yes gene_type:complete